MWWRMSLPKLPDRHSFHAVTKHPKTGYEDATSLAHPFPRNRMNTIVVAVHRLTLGVFFNVLLVFVYIWTDQPDPHSCYPPLHKRTLRRNCDLYIQIDERRSGKSSKWELKSNLITYHLPQSDHSWFICIINAHFRADVLDLTGTESVIFYAKLKQFCIQSFNVC